MFRKINVKSSLCIYGIKNLKSGLKNGKIIKIADFIDISKGRFLKGYLVFEISDGDGERLINDAINWDTVNKTYMLPKTIQEIYKKEMTILSLIEEELTDENL